MKHFIRLTALILVVLLLPNVYAQNLSTDEIFRGNSYWIMTENDDEDNVRGTYYVYLEADQFTFHAVKSDGTDYFDAEFGWSYDAETNCLHFSALETGKDSGTFVPSEEGYRAAGYHYRKMEYCPDSKKYEDAYLKFRQEYGSRNFAIRLLRTDVYMDYNRWFDETLPYEHFRSQVVNRADGVVFTEPDDLAQMLVENKLLFQLDVAKPEKYHVDALLSNIIMPMENDGTMQYKYRTEVINLVYADPAICDQAFQTLSANKETVEENLRGGVFNQGFLWTDENEKETAFIGKLPYSIVIFYGSNFQVRQMLCNLDRKSF